jgi:hypothetical protein
MKTVDVLTKAKELISQPDNWYKGHFTHPDKPDCFCIMGAIGKALGIDVNSFIPSEDLHHMMYNPASEAIRKLIQSEHGGISGFNDSPKTDHAKVMTAFDLAIASVDKNSRVYR